MGTWGTGIFSNDTASDIRDEYQMYLQLQMSDEDAEQLVLEAYKDYLGTEDEPIFWIALAACQWKKGRLSPRVKAAALQAIDTGADLELWEKDSADYRKRVHALHSLKEQLLSPMPPRRPVRKPTLQKCPWKPGDLLSYRLTSLSQDYPEYQNKYTLLRVLDIVQSSYFPIKRDIYYDEIPVCAVYHWLGDTIPHHKIIHNLDYLIFRTYTYPDEYIEHNCSGLIYDRKELKQHDIQLLDTDPSFLEQIPNKFNLEYGRKGRRGFVCLDYTIAVAYKKH